MRSSACLEGCREAAVYRHLGPVETRVASNAVWRTRWRRFSWLPRQRSQTCALPTGALGTWRELRHRSSIKLDSARLALTLLGALRPM